MHTNTETYDAVLEGLDADNLVAVTKYTMGDFYSWLPDNPTLSHGDQPRVVEFQSRREFEAFSAIPNHLSTHQQQALQGSPPTTRTSPGIWVWTQDGGPWRAGPMSLYLKSGFWQLYDADVYATGRLGWDVRRRRRRGHPRLGRAHTSRMTRHRRMRSWASWPTRGRSSATGSTWPPTPGAGPGARPGAAADDVDLRVGHRLRGQRRPQRHPPRERGLPRRGDRPWPGGRGGRGADAGHGQRHRPRGVA